MKVAELKELCKVKNLGTSGKKADLITRLLEVQDATGPVSSDKAKLVTDDLDDMSLEDLRDAAKGRMLPYTGSREEVLERMRQDIQMAKDIQEDNQPIGRDGFVALSHLLEMKAKEIVPTIPKFVNVKITSMGLVPEKFTVGGAPSVTADVIRKLAGDPFADPPKYGTVCIKHCIFICGQNYFTLALTLSFL